MPMQTAITMQTIAGWLLAGGVTAALLWWKYGRNRRRLDRTSHGTASWAGEGVKHCLRTGLLPLGREPGDGRLLFFPQDNIHTSVFAPTGSGKGVGYLIPIALTYPGSLAIIDVKGECRDIAAKRRSKLGKVYVLDPYGQGGDTFNPLDMVKDLDDAAALAEALVVRNPQGEVEAHWNDMGQTILTGVIALVAVACRPEERNLNSVREILAGNIDAAAKKLIELGGLYARYGHLIQGMGEKEKAGVISTCVRHLSFLDSPRMDAQVKASSCQLESIVNEAGSTLFVVLPPEHLQAKIGWLRLITTCLVRMVARVKSRNELLLLVDETGQLQGLPALLQAITLMRSYKLKCWLFFQSTEQLKETFGKAAPVVLDNTAKLFFGVASLDTAKYVSESLGAYTQVLTSYSSNTSRSKNTNEYGLPSHSVSTSDNASHSTHQRLLLTPDEVLQLPRKAVVALLNGLPPLLVKRIEWFREGHLKRLQQGR